MVRVNRSITEYRKPNLFGERLTKAIVGNFKIHFRVYRWVLALLKTHSAIIIYYRSCR